MSKKKFKKDFTKELIEKEIVLEKDLTAEKDLVSNNFEKDLELEKDFNTKKRFTDIKKLKCNFNIYKKERTKLKMPLITKCQNCNNEFLNNDFMYSAYIKDKNIKENYIICKNCAGI